MLKKILLFLLLLFPFSVPVFAESPIEIINSYDFNNNESSLLGEEYHIDLTNLKADLENSFPDSKIDFEWTTGTREVNSPMFKENFKNLGERKIVLNIYQTEPDGTRNLVYNKEFVVFVYSRSIPLIVSSKLGNADITHLKNLYKQYDYKLTVVSEFKDSDFELTAILPKVEQFYTTKGDKSDYIIVWGDKDFLFNTLSKLNREIDLSKYNSGSADKKISYNFYMLSDFNLDVVSSYFKNFLINKDWIGKVILTSEQARFKLTKDSLTLDNVVNSLDESKYPYLEPTKEGKLQKYSFISRFISHFSNKGFDVDSIYIIILIPFILTLMSFFKHLIGFSTLGTMVPLFLIILGIKMGVLITLGAFVLIFLVNVIILRFILGKRNLLYTPKISFILTINLVCFIIAFDLVNTYTDFNLSINDGVYLIMLMVVSERLISIMVSKEFSEYRRGLFYTIVIAIVGFFIFSNSYIKLFLLSYPEIMLALIPIDYLIGKFTGLRITEYFRFRELIKSIEE